MATAAAAAVPHQIPPIHLPQAPRIRPPRLLPGTPGPETIPQPPGPVPHGQVWVQGKWRNQASNAAKHHQRILSQRVRKALKHHTHGMNIYAYKHIRSSQVVYSLTRNMESGQIMPQLVFHGKKTVPESLRRDVWRPYFSIHFPESPAGAKAGLTAYQRLREFSMRRQLDPPRELLITTEEDIKRQKNAAGDPLDVREKLMNREVKFPVVNQLLPKKLRARKLMNQMATSVADLAFVLTLARSSLPRLEKEALVPLEDRDRERLKLLGRKGRKRLHAIRGEEEEHQKDIVERQALVETVDVNQGKMPLDRTVARQLSVEYDGAVADSNRVVNMADIERAKNSSQRDPYEIQVLWADVRDGAYAKAWPKGVFHGELQPLATSKRAEMRVRQHKAIDDEGVLIEEQLAPTTVVSGSSPHIIGREKGQGYRPFQAELKKQDESRRPARETEAARLEEYEEMLDFVSTRAKYVEAIDAFEQLISDPRFATLTEKEANGEYLDPDERASLSKLQERQSRLLETLAPLRKLETKHPRLAAEEDRREYWSMHSESESKPRLERILRRRTEAMINTNQAEIATLRQKLDLPDHFVETQRKIIAIEVQIEEAQDSIEGFEEVKLEYEEAGPDKASAVSELTAKIAEKQQLVQNLEGELNQVSAELRESLQNKIQKSNSQVLMMEELEKRLQRALGELERLQVEKKEIEQAGPEQEEAVRSVDARIAKQERSLQSFREHLERVRQSNAVVGVVEGDKAAEADLEQLVSEFDPDPQTVEENLQKLSELVPQLDAAESELAVLKQGPTTAPFEPYTEYVQERDRLSAAVNGREQEIKILQESIATQNAEIEMTEMHLEENIDVERKRIMTQMRMEAQERGESFDEQTAWEQATATATESAAADEAVMSDKAAVEAARELVTSSAEHLEALREAQEGIQASLESLETQMMEEFVQSEYDTSDLLPQSWRDEKYWPATEEEESGGNMSRVDEEHLRRAERERHKERQEEVKREEGKGLLYRLLGRIGYGKS